MSKLHYNQDLFNNQLLVGMSALQPVLKLQIADFSYDCQLKEGFGSQMIMDTVSGCMLDFLLSLAVSHNY